MLGQTAPPAQRDGWSSAFPAHRDGMVTALSWLRFLQFSGVFTASRMPRNACFIEVNPAVVLRIGSCPDAVSAAHFLQCLCKKSARLEQNQKSRDHENKAGISGGRDKGNRHHVGPVSEIVVVCTLFSWSASGTMVLDPTCRDLAQSLGVAGF